MWVCVGVCVWGVLVGVISCSSKACPCMCMLTCCVWGGGGGGGFCRSGCRGWVHEHPVCALAAAPDCFSEPDVWVDGRVCNPHVFTVHGCEAS